MNTWKPCIVQNLIGDGYFFKSDVMISKNPAQTKLNILVFRLHNFPENSYFANLEKEKEHKTILSVDNILVQAILLALCKTFYSCKKCSKK